MELNTFIVLIKESLVLIAVVSALLLYAILRGQYALVGIILGLYIALLVSIKFPYYDKLYALAPAEGSEALLSLIMFAVLTFIVTVILKRHLPYDGNEPPFEAFGKKLLLALVGAALIMAYSYHVLPVTTFVEPGTPVSMLFAPESNFFWWLIAPLGVLLLI